MLITLRNIVSKYKSTVFNYFKYLFYNQHLTENEQRQR